MKKEPRDRMSTRQEFQAMKLIEAHGVVDGERYVYADGWDDARVAAEVGDGVTEASIAYRRKAAFGKLRTRMPALPVPSESATIEELRHRIEVLELQVSALLPTTATKPNGTKSVFALS